MNDDPKYNGSPTYGFPSIRPTQYDRRPIPIFRNTYYSKRSSSSRYKRKIEEDFIGKDFQERVGNVVRPLGISKTDHRVSREFSNGDTKLIDARNFEGEGYFFEVPRRGRTRLRPCEGIQLERPEKLFPNGVSNIFEIEKY